MNKRRWTLYAVAAALLAACALWARSHVHFEWSIFRDQLQHVDWRRIALSIALIWLGYLLRAARWSLLLRPQKKVSPFSLVGSQVIGFTAVALFGRIADLVRPYLVSRRTQLPLSSQVAVYTVERMFDLGAMALIFSSALLLAPDRATLPHHEALERSALVGLALAVALAVFAISVRASGKAIARAVEKILGGISAHLGHLVAVKIRTFRDGLDAISTWSEFCSALAISLLMWGMVTAAYLETTHAFVLSPHLSSMTLARCLVLMAASMVGSVVQLPVIGWFTQIGVTTGVMQNIFNVSFESALACGALLLIVTFMSVIPLGLAWARVDHVSLKKVSEESEHVVEEAVEERAVVG